MENLPTPLSRVELYLAKACGMDVTTPEPGPRLEHFLYAIAYNTTPPSAGYRTEEWLAYVQGVTPQKTLKIEGACLIGNEKVDVRYFAVAAGVPGATLPPKPQNRKEEYWAYIATHRPAPGILKYVTGTNFYLTDVVSGIEELQYVHGDTYQQTYSGKNIIDFATINYSSANAGSATRDGVTYTVVGDSGGNFSGIQFTQTNLQLEPDTTYTVSATVTSTTNPDGSVVFVVGTMNTTGSNISGNYAKAGERTVATFTTPSSIPNSASIRLYPRLASTTAVFTDIMIEKSSSATAYEPYTGGIPAPNPNYPQPIQVVTGEQTVTIGDGVDSEAFPISLGSLELCKIGDYQDYIYKSGDDWYVHKDLSSLVFDGSEDWSYASGSAIPFRYAIADAGQLAQAQTTPPDVYSNYYTPYAWNNSSSVNYGVTASTNSSSLNIICFRNIDITSLANWKTWLSTHNTIVYYPLATPTDTKITDATLVGQLEAINSAVLPKPVASITIGATGTNLEAILTIAYYGSEE